MPNYLSTQAAKLVKSPDSVDLIQEKALNPLRSHECGAARGGLLFDFTIGEDYWPYYYLGILKSGWVVNQHLCYFYAPESLGETVNMACGYADLDGNVVSSSAFCPYRNVAGPGQTGFLASSNSQAVVPTKLDQDVWLIIRQGTAVDYVVGAQVIVYIDLLL